MFLRGCVFTQQRVWLNAKVMFLRACRLWRWALVTQSSGAQQATEMWIQCMNTATTVTTRGTRPPKYISTLRGEAQSKFCNQILHCVSVFPYFSQTLENIAVVCKPTISFIKKKKKHSKRQYKGVKGIRFEMLEPLFFFFALPLTKYGKGHVLPRVKCLKM